MRRPSAKESSGFTLLELSLAITVLLIGIVTMSASTVRMQSLRRQNREHVVAQNAIRAVSEQIHALAALALDDPDSWGETVRAAVSPGGSLGPAFDVVELTAQQDFPTVGDTFVVVNEMTTDAELGVQLGMPRDLNGDGVISDSDVTDTSDDLPPARILPVVVRARWQGQNGAMTIVHPFYVMGY